MKCENCEYFYRNQQSTIEIVQEAYDEQLAYKNSKNMFKRLFFFDSMEFNYLGERLLELTSKGYCKLNPEHKYVYRFHSCHQYKERG